jgi:hypothetical protein
VSSERYSVSLEEVELRWSMDDVWTAHQVLDMHEDAATLAHNEAVIASRRPR